MSIDDSLPNDVATLQSMLVAERAARLAAQSEAQYRAVLIEKLKFTIKKLRHERFGQSAERGVLLDPLTTWSRAIADIAFPSSLCPARPLDIDLMNARMCRVAAFRRTLLPALTFRRTISTYAGLRSR